MEAANTCSASSASSERWTGRSCGRDEVGTSAGESGASSMVGTGVSEQQWAHHESAKATWATQRQGEPRGLTRRRRAQ